MKSIIMLIAAAFAMTGVFAQTTTENFNSREDVTVGQVKGFLQSHCWQFHDFDVNNGWDPAIEGDGAMVSGTGASATQNAGIISPLLSLNGTTSVHFKYKFSANVTDRRWIKVLIANETNSVVSILDSIELTGASNTMVYTYDKVLQSRISGCYKIYINYQGVG